MLDTEDLDLTSWAAVAIPDGQDHLRPWSGTLAGPAAVAQDGWPLPPALRCSVPKRCWWNGPCNHTSAAAQSQQAAFKPSVSLDLPGKSCFKSFFLHKLAFEVQSSLNRWSARCLRSNSRRWWPCAFRVGRKSFWVSLVFWQWLLGWTHGFLRPRPPGPGRLGERCHFKVILLQHNNQDLQREDYFHLNLG